MIDTTAATMTNDDDDEKIEFSARCWASSALPSSLTKSVFVKSLGHKSIVVRQAFAISSEMFAADEKANIFGGKERDCEPDQAT